VVVQVILPNPLAKIVGNPLGTLKYPLVDNPGRGVHAHN
jgi:hypothetical protein